MLGVEGLGGLEGHGVLVRLHHGRLLVHHLLLLVEFWVGEVGESLVVLCGKGAAAPGEVGVVLGLAGEV